MLEIGRMLAGLLDLFFGSPRAFERVLGRRRNTLDEDIALAFSKHYSVEPKQVLLARHVLRSWDGMEALCVFTLLHGYSNPWHCIGLFLGTPEGRAFRDLYKIAGDHVPEK